MPLRLVRYAPNSCEGEVVDGAVISTRDERRCFPHAGRADGGEAGRRTPSPEPVGARSALPSIPRGVARADGHLQVASTISSPVGGSDCSRSGGASALPQCRWETSLRAAFSEMCNGLLPERVHIIWPIRLPGLAQAGCYASNVPIVEGNGSIVAIDPGPDGTFHHISTILAGSSHHSYPCVVQDGEAVYFLPEAPERGGTRPLPADRE